MKVELLGITSPFIADRAARCCTSAHMPEHMGSTKALEAACLSGHLSVLEHIYVSFGIEGISRACSHQLVRHRLMAVSQQSQRYVKSCDFDYVRPQTMEADERVKEVLDTYMAQTADLYEALVDLQDIPQEDARCVLPNACCTNMVVSMNLRELSHICQLRMCSRAQAEIRDVVGAMARDVLYILHLYRIYTLDKLFAPQCMAQGYCPEAKTCGKEPTLKELRDAYEGAGHM